MSDLLNWLSVRGSGGRIAPARPLTRMPTVTVVIPNYNYGRYLRDCVASLTNGQPGIDLEIIIVDDASSDDSATILDSLVAEDARIKVIRHETNKGAITTYNDGLSAASGEFVLLLSADDLATSGALTRAASLLAAEPSVGMVYGNAIDFTSELPPARTELSDWIVWPGVEWLRARCRSGYNVISSPEAMMRTSTLREIGGYRHDLPHAGDFEMWMRTAAVADIGFLVGVDQAYYRNHVTSMQTQSFGAGTDRGKLIDLEQRWKSFEAVFDGAGRGLSERNELLQVARRTIARQAVKQVNYAYARGFRHFPADDFGRFAYKVYPDVMETSAGRALTRRRAFGMMPLPLHPLWAPAAIAHRLSLAAVRWRRRRVGV